MAQEIGGRADKGGNTYENSILASLLIDLMLEQIISVEVEPLGKDGVGVEFVVERPNGDQEYYQCKGSNGVQVYWRPSDLNSHSVFQTAKTHILSGNRHTYHFISPVAYKELDSLCNRARTCSDVDIFVSHQLTNSDLKTWWLKCCSLFGEDKDNTFYLLQRCFFKQIPDSVEWTRKLEELLSLLFIMETKGKASAILVALKNNINEGKLWGQKLTASDVTGFLERQGFHLRLQEKDQRYLPKVQEINRIYRNSYCAIGGVLLPRTETKYVIDYIENGQSVLLLGKAGVGKSGCVQELTKILEERGILYLVLAIDKYCPEHLPDEYGNMLGFSESPVTCMNTLSGGKPVVIIFDQLDSLRWMNGSAASALDVCKEMIRQANFLNQYQGGHISIVFVSRKFDYETDPGIRMLFEKRDYEQNEWSKVEVGLLSDEDVRKITGESYNKLSVKLRDILKIPSNLYVWMNLDAGETGKISSQRQLLERWWQDVKKKCRNCGANEAQINRCLEKIVSIMHQKERLVLPCSVLRDYSNEVNFLASSGVLSKTNERVSFVHQSFFDYFSVEKQMSEIYEKDKHLWEFYAIKDRQTPDIRYQMLMLLQYMIDADKAMFLDECRQILESEHIHFYFQCCVFDILGQIEHPNNDEWELLKKYLVDEKWRLYVLRMVFFGHPPFIRLLSENDKKFIWWENEGIILLRSIMGQDAELAVDIIEKCKVNRFLDTDLYDILSADLNCRSKRGFELRIQLVRDNASLLQNDLTLYNMIDRGIPDAVRLIKEIVKADREIRNHIHLQSDDKLKRFAEHNAERIVNELAGPILKRAADESEEVYPWNNPWRDDGRRNSIERKLVSIVQTALSWMAENKTEYFLAYIGRTYSKTAIGQELMIHAVEKMPVYYADDAVKWLISDFNTNAFEYTSSEKTSLTACQRVIARFSPHCSMDFYTKLENLICQWASEKEQMQQVLEFRLQLREKQNDWTYFPSFWGELQYVLLPSLDQSRLSRRSKELLAVLRRKFPNGTDFFNIKRIAMASFVSSPVDKHLDKLSDKSWLNIVQSIYKEKNGRCMKRWNSGIESSPDMYARSLYTAAKREPTRFARLSLQFPDDIYEGFREEVLRACDSTDIPLKLTCEIIRKFCRQPGRELAIAFSHVIEKRANEDWPEDILQKLIDIAKNHPDPESHIVPAHTKNIDEETSCEDLWQASFNCARGCAIHAVTQLIWEHPDWSKRFRETLVVSVYDDNSAVLFSAMRLVHAWYNIDETCAKKMFHQLIQREIRTLFTQEAIALMCIVYHDNRDVYRNVLLQALTAPPDDLIPEVTKIATVLAAHDEWMETQLLQLPIDQKKADAISVEAALAMKEKQYHSYGKRLILHLLNSGFVGSGVVGLIYDKTLDLVDDHDLLVKMIDSTDRHLSNQTIEYLCDTDGNITGYVKPLLEFIENNLTSSRYYYEMRHLVRCIARAFQQGKENACIRQICLDIWDELFMRFPLEMNSFSESLDQ